MILPDRPSDPFPLILNHNVTVTINGSYALTKVDQAFENRGFRDIEGTYVFPVPKGGIRNFNLVVDGVVYEGKMLGSEEAKAIYQKYAIARKEASLLEYVGTETFAARLILPRNKNIRVQIEYEQILDVSSGIYHYSYPLSPERYTTEPIDPVSMMISISGDGKIGFVFSPTHNISVIREGNTATVSYYAKEIPNTDFELFYGVEKRDYDVNLLSNTGENGNYFMLFIYPTIEEKETMPKDFVFVIDTSGSMLGNKIENAKKALKYILRNLSEKDRFSIVAFSSYTQVFSKTLLFASEENISLGVDFVNSLEPSGSTNIYDALKKADTLIQGEENKRFGIIVLLTDGRDTVGHKHNEILRSIEGTHAKVFTFGVGEDIDFELLDKLSNEYGDGIPIYVRTDAELESVLTSFYKRISSPLIVNPKMAIIPSDSNLFVYEIYPKRQPDIFSGTQVVFAGRYNGSGSAKVIITGNTSSGPKSLEYSVVFPSHARNPFVERTWATRKVGYLLSTIATEGERPELVNEIKQLAKRYGIPSPYTSYVVAGEIKQEKTFAVPQSVAPWTFGATSVTAAQYESADSSLASHTSGIKNIGEKSFVLLGNVWKDTACSDSQAYERVEFGSKRYIELAGDERTAKYLSAGTNVVFCVDGKGIEIFDIGEKTDQPAYTSEISNYIAGRLGDFVGKVKAFLPAALIFIVLLAFLILSIMMRSRQVQASDIELHKALSSETRFDLLKELKEGEKTPTYLSQKFGKSKSTIVEHLEKLEEAGLVEKVEEEGKKFVFYRLTKKGREQMANS
ncbi:MAG: VWA domain-containing protein [Candidatus Micrarchaeia archaeon]